MVGFELILPVVAGLGASAVAALATSLETWISKKNKIEITIKSPDGTSKVMEIGEKITDEQARTILETFGKLMRKPKQGNSSVPLGVGLAGASGGTVFLGFVHLLTTDPKLSEAAQYAAPSAAIVISMIWGYILNQMDAFLADKKLANELRKAEADYKKAQSNPHATENLTAQMRDKVEALQLLTFDIHT